jgi:hypothetical protein
LTAITVTVTSAPIINDSPTFLVKINTYNSPKGCLEPNTAHYRILHWPPTAKTRRSSDKK